MPVPPAPSSCLPSVGAVELIEKQPTAKGPAEMFTGEVHMNVIARGEGDSRIRVNTVRFAPCARTAWHRHSLGQTLHVTDGVGVVVTRDRVIVMRPGDSVHTPPGEEHWHGAVPDQFMTHLAMWEGDDATWGDLVTAEEYAAATRQQDRQTTQQSQEARA